MDPSSDILSEIWFNMADVERSVALMEPENSSEMAVNYPPDETENEFEVEKIIAMVKTKVNIPRGHAQGTINRDVYALILYRLRP